MLASLWSKWRMIASDQMIVRQRAQTLMIIYAAFAALSSLYLPYTWFSPIYQGKRLIISALIGVLVLLFGFNIWLCRWARSDLSLMIIGGITVLGSVANTLVVGQMRSSMWTLVTLGVLGCFAQRARLNLIMALSALVALTSCGWIVQGTLSPLRLGDEMVRGSFVVIGANLAALFISRIHRQVIERLEQTRAHAREASQQARALREVSERERRVAEDASQAKDVFLAQISHELRTPLNAILGYAEILHEEFADLPDLPAQLSEDAARIRSAARHLLEMIQDVLDLSDIESGKLQMKPRAVDVSDMCREITTAMEIAMSERGNELLCEDHTAHARIVCDPVWLRQILFNLLSNAAKFTSEGRVTLSITEPAPDWMQLEVRDSGLGMSGEAQRRIFTEFEQAHVLTGRQFGGSGLGLPLCRTLAEHMGGELGLESAPGQGTRVWLRLPRGARDDQ